MKVNTKEIIAEIWEITEERKFPCFRIEDLIDRWPNITKRTLQWHMKNFIEKGWVSKIDPKEKYSISEYIKDKQSEELEDYVKKMQDGRIPWYEFNEEVYGRDMIAEICRETGNKIKEVAPFIASYLGKRGFSYEETTETLEDISNYLKRKWREKLIKEGLEKGVLKKEGQKISLKEEYVDKLMDLLIGQKKEHWDFVTEDGETMKLEVTYMGPVENSD